MNGSKGLSTRALRGRGRCALFVLACALLWGATGRARADDDPWIARDKALHFGVSAVLAGGTYAAVSPWVESPLWRFVTGFSVSLSLGAAKELWDLSGRGHPSVRDFTWDAVGALTGASLALAVDYGRRRRLRRAPAVALSCAPARGGCLVTGAFALRGR